MIISILLKRYYLIIMARTQVIMKGQILYSFGKNGDGISDELSYIGEIVKLLSKCNHVYITNTSIDSLDDVYDFVLHVVPREEYKHLFDNIETIDITNPIGAEEVKPEEEIICD